MSGLHEAFDEIVADVPVYGDLDRAIEQADRERRQRYGVLAGLAAAAAAVALIVGGLVITRDMKDSPQPMGPTPTPTETTETTAPVDLPANGRLVGAEVDFAGALRPCSVINADHELATPEAECVIAANDVDAIRGIGLFREHPTNSGTTTLRIATQDEVIGRFRSPDDSYDAELGPGADEISLTRWQEITVVGFDGRKRRSIDLSDVLLPLTGTDRGEDIVSLEWSPDGTRAAVVSHLNTPQGMSSQIWIVDEAGGQPQLVYTATNTGSVPANQRPLAYVWSVTWSPRGDRLAFIEELAYIGGQEVSQSMRAATLTLSGSGTSAGQVVYDDYPKSTYFEAAEILWSPDGARLALRVPDQVLELSAKDGRILARHPMITGKLVWLPRQ
jgi:hypothetical protein